MASPRFVTALDEQTEGDCMDAFETFAGSAYDDTELDFPYLYPTAESWPAGDREITCLVGAAEKVTGSLKDSKR